MSQAIRPSWSKTLQLPRSPLPSRPPLISSPYLRTCVDEHYQWQAKLLDRPKWILHDGPPYANGSLHIGHAMNKILKDIICRFQVSQGNRIEYIPGWDCHGMPIEVKALKELKTSHDNISPLAIRKAARSLATKTIEEQKSNFKEWAIMADWDNAYQTMNPEYEMRQLRVFKNMVESGLIYRARMPVYWSPSSQTALAEAELEYDAAHVSQAAYVLFPLTLSNHHDFAKVNGTLLPRLNALIWTTTPWTLPANRAIAINKSLKYSVIEIEKIPNSCMLIAESRLPHLKDVHPNYHIKILKDGISGHELVNAVNYQNCFNTKYQQPIIHADFVTDSMGTGLVHVAPGHGHDDFIAAKAYGIEVHCPIDNRGFYTSDAFPSQPDVLQGKRVGKEGSEAVLNYLKPLEQGGLVLMSHELTHKYPIDWRTKKPVIIRVTEQWFADIDSIKDAAIKAIDSVKFIPKSGKLRLTNFITGRSHWCISRQRAWGLPIPALYRIDVSPEEPIIDSETIEYIIKTIEKRGIDAWWSDAEDEPAWIPAHLKGKYIRGKDTMDVWFDSGTSWSQLDTSSGTPPADIYLEGSDQHRGWFQSSLLTFVAHQIANGIKSPVAPFKTNITHGFVLDAEGRKMSKSLGNVISPSEVMNGSLLPPLKPQKSKGKNKTGNKSGDKVNHDISKGSRADAMGADALRLWVASVDYTPDVSIGSTILKSVQGDLTKLRITLKWLLGVLSNYQPPSSPNDSRDPSPAISFIDDIALRRLEIISSTIHTLYHSADFARATTALTAYIHTDLSAFYFETLKDRLYAGCRATRAAAHHAALLPILLELLAMLAPILPLLVAEVWHHVPAAIAAAHAHPLRRVWARPFAVARWDAARRDTLDATFDGLVALRRGVAGVLEERRVQGRMGSSLQCDLVVEVRTGESNGAGNGDSNAGLWELVGGPHGAELLETVLVVSRVVVGRVTVGEEDCIVPVGESGLVVAVKVMEPSGLKCDRCWRYLELHDDGLCGRCEQVVRDEHGDVSRDIITSTKT